MENEESDCDEEGKDVSMRGGKGQRWHFEIK
jgi:hypothetical protein